MVNSASKVAPPHLEDGEISETKKTKPLSTAAHKTYSILDNPLISNPTSNAPRHVSARARKVIAWTKKMALRETRARQADYSQRAKDDRPRIESRDGANRSRRWHPSKRLNDSRPNHHRPRLGTSVTDEDNDYDDKENFNQPTPETFNDYQSRHHHRYDAQPDEQSMYPSDQQHQHQSSYSEPRRSFQLDRHAQYPSDQQSKRRSVYLKPLDEPRRSSYPPQVTSQSRWPPTRQQHLHPPNLVSNYPPSHYHPYSQPSVQPSNLHQHPVHQYEPVDPPPFPSQQPLCVSQPSAIREEYTSHPHQPHQAQIAPVDVYYTPPVHHSDPQPVPSGSNHEISRNNHPPYYVYDSLESRRQVFQFPPEQPGQEHYPVHPHQSQPVMATRFVSNYPVPPTHHDLHHSLQPTTSSHRIETRQMDSFQTSPSLVHHSASVEFESDLHQNSPAHSNLDKDQLWRTEHPSRWEHEPIRVDSYNQHERPQEFSREEEPSLISLEPRKQSQFYHSCSNDDQALNVDNNAAVKNRHDQQSQWYQIDDDYMSQKKEAQEILTRLISWGVTADYLLSIGISESLVRGMYGL